MPASRASGILWAHCQRSGIKNPANPIKLTYLLTCLRDIRTPKGSRVVNTLSKQATASTAECYAVIMHEL